MHPQVEKIWRSFPAIGLMSPQSCITKEFLLQPACPGEKIAIVILDVIRCGTTLSVALAKGCGAVVITQKQTGAGCTRQKAEAVRAKLSLDKVVEGGELHGKPIPGSIIANSPLQASKNGALKSTLLRFSSTNFGGQFFQLMPLVEKLIAQGGAEVTVVIGNAFNTQTIAEAIKDQHRVFFAAGGFYAAPSFEDLVVAGKIIHHAGFSIDELDDEARMMLACHELAIKKSNDKTFYTTTVIGRCLTEFGVAADIAAAIDGTGLCPFVKRKLHYLIPTVSFVSTDLGNIPTILPRYVYPKKNVFAEAEYLFEAVLFAHAV